MTRASLLYTLTATTLAACGQPSAPPRTSTPPVAHEARAPQEPSAPAAGDSTSPAPTTPRAAASEGGSIPAPIRVEDERSAYGKFRQTFREADDSCLISVVLELGEQVDLLTVPDCIDNVIAALHPVQRVGNLEFPVRASDGQEFHLFAIATARGGNAIATDDYWVIVLKPKSGWGAFVSSAEFTHAEFFDRALPELILEQPATTAAEGERVTIHPEQIRRSVLPQKS